MAFVFSFFLVRLTTYSDKTMLPILWRLVLYCLRYKPEGFGFNSRWCHWIFSLT